MVRGTIFEQSVVLGHSANVQRTTQHSPDSLGTLYCIHRVAQDINRYCPAGTYSEAHTHVWHRPQQHCHVARYHTYSSGSRQCMLLRVSATELD